MYYVTRESWIKGKWELYFCNSKSKIIQEELTVKTA